MNVDDPIVSDAMAIVTRLRSQDIITDAVADTLTKDLPRRCDGWKRNDKVQVIRWAFELGHRAIWFDRERDTPPYYPELLDIFADASNGIFSPEAAGQLTDYMLNYMLYDGFVVLQFISGHRLYRVRLQFLGDWCDVTTLIPVINRAVADLGCDERFVLMEPDSADASIVFTNPASFLEILNEQSIPALWESGDLTVDQVSTLPTFDEELIRGHWDIIRGLFRMEDRAVSSQELLTFRDEDGRTALHVLCERTHDLQWTETLARFLISNGADVNAVDPGGRTPLHVANSASVVSALTELGADPMRTDCAGAYPLHHAAADQDKSVVSAFLNVVKDINLPTTSARPQEKVKHKRDWILEEGFTALKFSLTPKVPGQTPLHYAAYGNTETATLLLDRGAAINAVDSMGQTAILQAAPAFQSPPMPASCPHLEISMMSFQRTVLIAACIFAVSSCVTVGAEETALAQPGCIVDDRFFEAEVWAKVGERTCFRCHNVKGDAADSDLILVRPDDVDGESKRCLKQNSDAFQKMARSMEGDQSRLLLKVAGELDHGGGQVLKLDSTGSQILQRYVRRSTPKSGDPIPDTPVDDYTVPPFFDGVAMISPPRLLRQVTLSLVGRLPSVEEFAAVEQGGLAAIDPILDSLMREDTFYTRLKEGFNDIFLTVGIEDNAETLLSYDHFEKTRLWYQNYDFSYLPEAERQRAGWKMADVYRDALLREPLELIEYIVRNDRPFSELATADYIMVSPYTARGYGIFDELKGKFKNTEDPFAYLPAKLHAPTGRDGKTQESPTGLSPHAGFLSMFH